MAHSNKIREFVMTNEGIQLVSVHTGTGALLTDPARFSQEASDAAAVRLPGQGVEERRRRSVEQRP
jgi:circadian clock protein KaiC